MKKTETQRAIEQLEGEKRVIELAIDKLRQAQASKPTRVRKPKPATESGPVEVRR